MLTIFNANELRRAVEIDAVREDVECVLENSPAAHEFMKYV